MTRQTVCIFYDQLLDGDKRLNTVVGQFKLFITDLK